MNIQQYIDEVIVLPSTPATWLEMINRRCETFRGFLENEETKGFIQVGTPYETSRGQEMLRILYFRVLEEIGESIESQERDHQLEELIDAFNFLMGTLLLEIPLMIPKPSNTLQWRDRVFDMDIWWEASRYCHTVKPSIEKCTLAVVGVGDFLRNRAWMKQSQDQYFSGREKMWEVTKEVCLEIFQCFPDWETFYKFFIAKDEVLKFRLRSNY